MGAISAERGKIPAQFLKTLLNVGGKPAELKEETQIAECRQIRKLCDDVCDAPYFCEDESYCNGYKYGVDCSLPGSTRPSEDGFFPQGYRLCGGVSKCHKFSEILSCTPPNSSAITCDQYTMNVSHNQTLALPILNYTRCLVLDGSVKSSPFCLNYLDQTNCSDIARVGGYCKVNGFLASVSKYMVCNEYDHRSNMTIKLCDDDFQNRCVTTFPGCQIHKHRMCDGMMDCFDGSDEINDICQTTKNEFDFNCTRTFNLQIGVFRVPVSWIMDNDTDCMNGEDENEDLWKFCAGKYKMISLPGESCEDVFKCPGNSKSYVLLENLCDGIESCDEGNQSENKICRIAREFPAIEKTIAYNGTIRDLCNSSSDCEVREFKRHWGYVFGEPKIELYVPVSKVNCSQVFGEYYLFLSCLNLCLEPDVVCLLQDDKRKLEFDSCPGKYPNRSYTIVNNSFITLVDKYNTGRYHQDIFHCDNGRCVGSVPSRHLSLRQWEVCRVGTIKTSFTATMGGV